MSTPLLALGALLLIQLLLIAWSYWPDSMADIHSGPLLPDFDPDQVTRVEIADMGGQSITLERAASGWVIAETDGFPANSTDVDDLLGKLASVNTNRLVTQTPNSHTRLQVAADNFNRRLDFTTAEGSTRTVYLGNTAGGGATHIRNGDHDSVYLTSAVAAWEVEPFLSGWINTSYLSLAMADLRGLRLQNEHGEILLTRDAVSQWQMSGLDARTPPATLDAAAVNSLANQIAFLSLQNVLGQSPPAGADVPLITIEIDRVVPSADNATPEGEPLETIIVELGRFLDGETETYFAKSSESEYYVTVLAQTVDTLAAFTVDDLLVADLTEEASGAERIETTAPDDGPAAEESPIPDEDVQDRDASADELESNTSESNTSAGSSTEAVEEDPAASE